VFQIFTAPLLSWCVWFLVACFASDRWAYWFCT